MPSIRKLITVLGFLNLNKPTRWTSHDCVAQVRRRLNIKRVGHGGTLDPAATGVLPIAVGKATRLLAFLPEDKAYRARIRFGVRTATDDLEGEVIEANPPHLTREQVEPLLEQFIGQIEQIPPAYSAIQQGGKRLYELARQGKTVEAPMRTVQVDKIEVRAWYPGEFPELEVDIDCGPGTYIRAIARDLGAALGVGGTLAALTRTASCGLQLEQSLTFEQIDQQLEQDSFSLIAPDVALKRLMSVTLDAAAAKRWCQGQKLALNKLPPGFVRVHQSQGFLGVAQLIQSQDECLLIPKVVLT